VGKKTCKTKKKQKTNVGKDKKKKTYGNTTVISHIL
jgi:hypothetical protein